jgi:hypothetical protein
MEKLCNCPTCAGNRTRRESQTFLAIMERSFGQDVPELRPADAPVARANRD